MDDKLKNSLKGIEEIRIENTRNICEAVGSQTKLAHILGWERQNLWRLIAPNPGRTFTNKTARHIEIIFNLPKHWMDHCNTMTLDQLKNYLDYRSKMTETEHQEHANSQNPYAIGILNDQIKDTTMDFIPFLDLKSSTREGELVLDKGNKKMLITIDKMQELEIDVARAGCVKIDDTMMEPSLKDKSDVVINLIKTVIESGKIYLIKLNNQFIIRRLFVEHDNSVRISCDNPLVKIENPDINITQDKASALTVLGKVVSVVASL